jgi:hypothetical protein
VSTVPERIHQEHKLYIAGDYKGLTLEGGKPVEHHTEEGDNAAVADVVPDVGSSGFVPNLVVLVN